MGIFKYIANSMSFRIDLGIVLISFPFIMIGFLFISVLYLTFRLWISDIILKFLVECFTKNMVDMKDYPKKDRNRMNRYISVGLIIILMEPGTCAAFSVKVNKMVDYLFQISIAIITVILVYKNIKKLNKDTEIYKK